MFGVKIYPHRSLLILGIIIIFFLLIFLSNPHKKTRPIEKVKIGPDYDDEDINLIDLFNIAFKLTYEAGQSIKSIKNTKKDFGKIFKKKSFENLQSEPVTIADLISHSIITNGLKKEFTNLKVCFKFSIFI